MCFVIIFICRIDEFLFLFVIQTVEKYSMNKNKEVEMILMTCYAQFSSQSFNHYIFQKTDIYLCNMQCIMFKIAGKETMKDFI